MGKKNASNQSGGTWEGPVQGAVDNTAGLTDAVATTGLVATIGGRIGQVVSAPCPHCGHCPSCGRGPGHPVTYPVYPNYPVYPTYPTYPGSYYGVPQVWC